MALVVSASEFHIYLWHICTDSLSSAKKQCGNKLTWTIIGSFLELLLGIKKAACARTSLNAANITASSSRLFAHRLTYTALQDHCSMSAHAATPR